MKNVSFPEFADALRCLDIDSFVDWLRNYLKDLPCNPAPPSTPVDKVEFIEKLHRHWTLSKQESRIGIAIGNLIDCFADPRDNEEYLMHLLTLIVSIRPHRAKRGLRRLLYSGIVYGFTYDVFDLTNELIIANCKYGVDDQIVEFLSVRIPELPTFNVHSLACLRGLMFRYDATVFYYIPKLARFLKHEDYQARFSHQLYAAIARIGLTAFAESYPAVISHMGSPEATILNMLLSDFFVEAESRFTEPHYLEMYMRCNIALDRIIQPRHFALLFSNRVRIDRSIKLELIRQYRNTPDPAGLLELPFKLPKMCVFSVSHSICKEHQGMVLSAPTSTSATEFRFLTSEEAEFLAEV